MGTEVLVDFIEGDIDRPLVVAQLYTGADAPPYSAGVDSGVNHAGVISGIHSNNFDGAGYNQWQIDDTSGQLRTRLASSATAAQLNLGHLVQQAPGSAQRGAYRGSGFELRTDAWGVLRGGAGVLVSTSARVKQGSGVSSTQLDVAEAAAQLRGAGELSKNLAEAAAAQTALLSKDANQAQTDFITQIDPKQKGKQVASVGGHSALKAASGERALDAAQPVEAFAQPLVLMEAPSTVNWATPGSTLLFAGQHLQWSTQADLHMAAAHTVASVAANAAGWFTHSGGIQAIAGNGPVSLQAHTDRLEILADKEITVISVNDVIEIKAKEKIVLQAGQSSVTLEGGDITFACPGSFTVKGGQHVFEGGANKAAVLPGLPTRLNKFPSKQADKIGPHEVTIMCFSAEGEALTDAVVTFYDPKQGKAIAQRTIGGGGSTSVLTAACNQEYRALVGYQGWTAHFEEVGDVEDEDEEDPFEAGDLDEDRSIEHL
ncbi:uncharacterized protein (DUF2345 family) [Janthinobacterium sp. CG_S6]|nr:uncharacterized protein (DUF2345 family) [Janthinobacterium sp. CG_S6]